MESRWVGSGTLVAYKGLEFHGIIGEEKYSTEILYT